MSRFEERYGDYKPRSGKKGKLFKRPLGEPDPKDTVSAIPKTFETEGVAQTVTCGSRGLSSSGCAGRSFRCRDDPLAGP